MPVPFAIGYARMKLGYTVRYEPDLGGWRILDPQGVCIAFAHSSKLATVAYVDATAEALLAIRESQP